MSSLLPALVTRKTTADEQCSSYLSVNNHACTGSSGLCLADLVTNLLGTCIHLCTDVASVSLSELPCCNLRIVRDWKNLYLYRCQPGWECTCEVLDQDTDETLDGTKYNTVNHDRTMFLAVCSGVL